MANSLSSEVIRSRLGKCLPIKLINDETLMLYLISVIQSLAESPLPVNIVADVLKDVLLSAGLEADGGDWDVVWKSIWREDNSSSSPEALLTGKLLTDADSYLLLGNNSVVPFERPVQLDLDEGVAAIISGSAATDSVPTSSHGLASDVLELLHGKGSASASVSLDWLANRKSLVSQVNAAALAKAEARLVQKAEKRQRKEAGHYRAGKYGPSGQVARSAAEKEAERRARVEAILSEGSTEEDMRMSRSINLERFDISLPKRILTDASCVLVYGRRYGLIGRNGVGKSTFLRHLAGRQINGVPSYLSILHVEQEMAGSDQSALDSVLAADTRRASLLEEQDRLNYVIQNGEVDAEETVDQAEKRLQAVHRRLADLDVDRAIPRAASILAGLGFDAAAQVRATRTFSGGWRMRLALAQALFAEPDLLLLDEPTNMLDFPAVVWLQEHLQQWSGTLLVVSHDRLFLDSVATDILHLHSEQLVAYRGNYAQFVQTRTERLKNQQREYEAQLAYRQHLQAFVDRWRYNANRAPQAQSRLKILEKLPELKPVVIDAPVIFRFPKIEHMPAGTLVQLDNVGFKYAKEKIDSPTIISNVNFNLDLGARAAIVGPNGAGKTTFLKLVTGALEPTSGQATLNSRLRVGYFSQHHVDALSESSPESLETITPITWMNGKFPAKGDEECRRLLGSFGISGPLALQSISTLSGGQKSRLIFSALAASSPHLLILDEPTNHLDMDSIDALIEALRVYNGAVIAVSHDKRFIEEVAKEIWVCADKRVGRFEGTIHDYAESLMNSRK